MTVRNMGRADKYNTRPSNLFALGKSNLVSSGVAWLHTVTVNVSGGAGNEIDIYDTTNVTILNAGYGTRIARIDTARRLPPYTLTYNVRMLSGLIVDLSGGISADVTFSHSP